MYGPSASGSKSPKATEARPVTLGGISHPRDTLEQGDSAPPTYRHDKILSDTTTLTIINICTEIENRYKQKTCF